MNNGLTAQNKNSPIQKRNIQRAVISLFVLLNIFIYIALFGVTENKILKVAFLDVGQGDAIYIEAPNGNQLLIDGGPPSGATLRELGRVMPFWDRSLDVILVTHPDQDHIGGLPQVINRMQVDNFVSTENTSDTAVFKTLQKVAQQKIPRHVLARKGEKIILDDGVEFEVLFPDRNTFGWETNTSSIVGRLTYGNKSFLLTGDSPQSVEKYLIGGSVGILWSTVLKLGHHGSRTSSSKEFLSAVNPEYAIISAGKSNTYGHPHKEVVDLLTKLKIPSMSTIDHGTIIFKTDGEFLEAR